MSKIDKTLFFVLIKQGMLSHSNFFRSTKFDEMIDIMMEQKIIYVEFSHAQMFAIIYA